MTDTQLLIYTTETIQNIVPESNAANSVYIEYNNQIVADTEKHDTVISNSDIPTIVSGGVQDTVPIADESMRYIKRIDFISDNEFYKGLAIPGSSETAPVWQISKTVILSDNDMSVNFADATTNFSKAWADRVTYVYA